MRANEGGTRRAPCAVDLSDNTNRFGVPPAASRALAAFDPADAARYPSPFADDLRAAVARYAGVQPDEVTTGCGSDDVLDSAIRAFTAPGDVVAWPDPTFGMIPVFARRSHLRAAPVPLGRDCALDPDALLATGARLIYVCAPNNPTGTAFAREALLRVIEGAPGIVILDEAYAEFSNVRGFIGEAAGRGNLLVARTLSKAFGLAGLRVGYATGASALIARVEAARGPFKVTGPAERTAVAALDLDRDWMRARIVEAFNAREGLASALRALGFAPLPSAANFVLVPVRDAKAVAARMREGGVAVRAFTGLAGIGDAVRITVGPAPMMEAAVARLEEAAR